MVLEKTLESSLDYKEIQPVNPEGNQSWMFTGRTEAEAGAPILWPPDLKSRLIRKDPDAGKDWKQEEKGTIEDKMIGWHHHLNRHWVWANSWRWWKTGKPGMPQSMASQRVGLDWATELTDWLICYLAVIFTKINKVSLFLPGKQLTVFIANDKIWVLKHFGKLDTCLGELDSFPILKVVPDEVRTVRTVALEDLPDLVPQIF